MLSMRENIILACFYERNIFPSFPLKQYTIVVKVLISPFLIYDSISNSNYLTSKESKEVRSILLNFCPRKSVPFSDNGKCALANEEISEFSPLNKRDYFKHSITF